jgi:hypothetical protein
MVNGILARGTVADDWSTSYTGHFMIEAEKKDFLPINFKTKWISLSAKEAKQWRFMPSYKMIWHNRILIHLALAGARFVFDE